MGLGWFEGSSGNSTNNDLYGPAQSDADRNRFQFGGRAPDQGVIGHNQASADGLIGEGDIVGDMANTGSAADEANRYRTLAGAAASRQTPDTNYAPGNVYAQQGLQSREGQAGALAMMRQQATGAAPSAANLSMNRNNDAVTGNALAAMAGSRPGAVAGQQAAGNLSVQQAHNIGQSGNARAGEISGAQAGLLGGFQDMRQGDISGMQAQDARSQHMANLVLQQRGMDQAQQLGFEGMGMDVRNAQMNAGVYARMAAQRRRTHQGNLDVTSQGNANNTANAAVSGVTSGLSGLFGAGGAA